MNKQNRNRLIDTENKLNKLMDSKRQEVGGLGEKKVKGFRSTNWQSHQIVTGI